MDYFTSDMHFGHDNIIKHCGRPFGSSDEMNDEIIKRWNQTVTQDDTVYVVGDVFLCGSKKGGALVRQLSGKKILIKGNHDASVSKMLSSGFDEVYYALDYQLPDNRRAFICHYPMPHDLVASYDLQIHGHIHTGRPISGKRVNVCVDMWDFTPVSVEKISQLPLDDSLSLLDRWCKLDVDEDRVVTIDARLDLDNLSGLVSRIYQLIDSQNQDKEKE